MSKKLIALFTALMMACICGLASAETIIVATNPEYPPFEYVENDVVKGYDIDLIAAIAEKAGFDFEVESMAYDSIINAVHANPNTIGVAGISITPERLLTVNFSEGYIDAGLVVITKADAPYAVKEDLAGKLIGAQLGTTSDFAAEEITGTDNVQRYGSFLNAIMDLQGNKIDAVIVDKPVGMTIMAELNDPSLKMVDMDLQADWYGIEVNKNNPELLEKINAALAELKEEGFMEELLLKYTTADSSDEAAE